MPGARRDWRRGFCGEGLAGGGACRRGREGGYCVVLVYPAGGRAGAVRRADAPPLCCTHPCNAAGASSCPGSQPASRLGGRVRGCRRLGRGWVEATKVCGGMLGRPWRGEGFIGGAAMVGLQGGRVPGGGFVLDRAQRHSAGWTLLAGCGRQHTELPPTRPAAAPAFYIPPPLIVSLLARTLIEWQRQGRLV